MKIFMGHHSLDALEAHVGCDVGVSEHARSVKHIQALVLHRTHIEVIDGNNVVEIKVILESVNCLIPTHGLFERRHCVVAVTQILFFDPNMQVDRFTRRRCEHVTGALQIARHHGEQVAGLGKRVMPHSTMPALIEGHLLDQIAVAE